MSLSDLKKSNTSAAKKKSFTVDEFIDDAENYAKGQPKIVSAESEKALMIEQVIKAAKHEHQQKKQQLQQNAKRLKHATFTLGDEIIEQLNELANETKLAKSHILRILVAELANKEKEEQRKKLLNSGIE